MHDSLFMRRFERFTDVFRNLQSFFDWNRTALDAFVQRLAFYKFEHEKTGIVSLLEIVDGGDVRMVQRSQNLCFALEAADALRITREFFGQDLDRYFSLKLRVACAIDLAL